MLFLNLPIFLLSLPLLKSIHHVYNFYHWDKTLTKMNLGRKGFDSPYILQSIIKESQSRNSRQELGGEAEVMEDTAYWVAHPG